MKQEEIEKGNKLISNFIGRVKAHEKIEDCEDPIVLSIERDGFSGAEVSRKTRPFTHADEKFHSSFDWLMPVVEKIRGMGKIVSIEFFDEETVCQIRHSSANLLADFSGSNESNTKPSIEAVWLAVVEFINWRNKQQ